MSDPKRLNCDNVMTIDIGLSSDVQPAMLLDLSSDSDVMQLDLRADVMQLQLCWPDIHAEYVTHNGQQVTVNGEPVYLLVQD